MAEKDLKSLSQRHEDEESLEEGECLPKRPYSPNLSQIPLPTSGCYSPISEEEIRPMSRQSPNKRYTFGHTRNPNSPHRNKSCSLTLIVIVFSFSSTGLSARPLWLRLGVHHGASTPVVPPPSIYELIKEDFTHKYLRNFQKSVESLFQVPSIDGKSLNIIMYEYESQKHSYKILNISKRALVTNVSSKKRAKSKAVDHMTILQKCYDNRIKILNAELKKAKSR